MKHIPVLLIFALALLAGILFSSCTKQSNPVTNYIYTHSDSALVGTMLGYVDYRDTTTYYRSGRVAGVDVSLDGTPFHTLTDATGKWVLQNIPAGIYNITYAKSGYAIRKTISHQFIGNGTDYLGEVSIDQLAALYPTLLLRPFDDYRLSDSTLVPKGKAMFTATANDADSQNMSINMCIVLSKTDKIDPNDSTTYLYRSNLYTANRSNLPSNFNNLFDFTFYKNTLISYGFQSGDQVYCAVYGTTGQGKYDYYFDINSGRTIYTGFSPNHSDIKSFILP